MMLHPLAAIPFVPDSPFELILIALIGLLIFGKRLPEVGRSVGRSIVEFKKGLKGVEDEITAPEQTAEARNTLDAPQQTAQNQLPGAQAADGASNAATPEARFDPYTGKPLQPKFDPYTGKPLDQTESVAVAEPSHSA